MREVMIHSSMRTASLRVTEGHGGAQFEVAHQVGSDTRYLRFWVPAPEIGRLLRGLGPMEVREGERP